MPWAAYRIARAPALEELAALLISTGELTVENLKCLPAKAPTREQRAAPRNSLSAAQNWSIGALKPVTNSLPR
jgi:hypothetical protein